jgi:hypothetical protein
MPADDIDRGRTGPSAQISIQSDPASFGPWALDDAELDEQPELVDPDPFPHGLVLLEMQDGDHPFLDGPLGRSPPDVSPEVGAGECRSEDDSVPGHDHVLDVQVEIRKCVVADRFDLAGTPVPNGLEYFSLYISAAAS